MDNQIDDVFNLDMFKINFNNRFANILDRIHPKMGVGKDLVFRRKLRNLMELMIERDTLVKRNVALLNLNNRSAKLYKDDDESILVFIISTEEEDIKKVREFTDILISRKINRQTVLVFYPEAPILAHVLLEKHGLMEIFKDSILEFDTGAIPLAVDLLSFESMRSTKNLFISKDFEPYHSCSNLLLRLQLIYGESRSIISLGEHAKEALELYQRQEEKKNLISESNHMGYSYRFDD